MHKMKYVDFIPKWIRDATEEDEILKGCPTVGTPGESAPRIHTRIIPISGIQRISARTVSDIINQTQNLVMYAGYDVYHGVNPDFADLRSVNADVVYLTQLVIEPFEEGSFVIPSRLETDPIQKKGSSEQLEMVTAEDVVRRFGEMFSQVVSQNYATQVSIGAIHTMESLGRTIDREAKAIEFSTFDSFGQSVCRESMKMDAIFADCVRKVRLSRQPTEEKMDTLEGYVTAIDVSKRTIRLTLKSSNRRVCGTFSIHQTPLMVESLVNRTVIRLEGYVERKGKNPSSIQVLSAEAVADK